ncbi:hypothetical protein V6N13_004089 [Hibiscus sabdariffa]|uniref:Uncharacterized protein n=1 Tax=Hibiscus sabdariffa TaxID=183260 RepID=A0ABR2RY92_9ROSI
MQGEEIGVFRLPELDIQGGVDGVNLGVTIVVNRVMRVPSGLCDVVLMNELQDLVVEKRRADVRLGGDAYGDNIQLRLLPGY